MHEAFLSLPKELSSKSLSTREVVLPLKDALRAIEILDAAGFHILGWEGWVKTVDGRVGHGNAGQYATTLPDGITSTEAVTATKNGIVEDALNWSSENVATTDTIYFCITARVNKSSARAHLQVI